MEIQNYKPNYVVGGVSENYNVEKFGRFYNATANTDLGLVDIYSQDDSRSSNPSPATTFYAFYRGRLYSAYLPRYYSPKTVGRFAKRFAAEVAEVAK